MARGKHIVSDIELDYEYLANNALRRVVADVLAITTDLGEAPGEHHFYIEFATDADGVVMPDDLRAAYPKTMTIVLQHQFENLIVDETGFSVTLWFKGKQADLRIPFDAMVSFADPSVQFGLRFDMATAGAQGGSKSLSSDAGDTLAPPAPEQMPAPPPKVDEKDAAKPDTDKQTDKENEGADVVSLDSFRKK